MRLNDQMEQSVQSTVISTGTVEQSTALASNWEALNQLENQLALVQASYYTIGSVLVAGCAAGAPFSAWALLTFPPIAALLDRNEKLTVIMQAMAALLNEFGDNILCIPRIQIGEKVPIDLFVKLSCCNLIFAFRTRRDAKVIYSEKNELLTLRTKRGGLQKWKPDPLTELSSWQRWVRDNRNLLGLSSRESRLPTARVLVLTGATMLDESNENLQVLTDDQKFLWIRKNGTTALIRSNQVMAFTKAYFNQERKKLDAK
jgi:hypothetical protein